MQVLEDLPNRNTLPSEDNEAYPSLADTDAVSVQARLRLYGVCGMEIDWCSRPVESVISALYKTC